MATHEATVEGSIRASEEMSMVSEPVLDDSVVTEGDVPATSGGETEAEAAPDEATRDEDAEAATTGGTDD